MDLNEIITLGNIATALAAIAGALTLIALKMDNKNKKNHHR